MTLYVNDAQIDDAVRAHLGNEVEIQAYDAIWGHLKQLGNSMKANKEDVGRVIPDPGTII